MYTLNATAPLVSEESVLFDFQANKSWAWDNKYCFAEAFHNTAPHVGSCFADGATLTKLQVGSIGPFPVQWWAAPRVMSVNTTYVSSMSADLKSLTELLRVNGLIRNDKNDGFQVQEFEDFKAGPIPANTFVLPANCPQ
jgi:hypothetical protein